MKSLLKLFYLSLFAFLLSSCALMKNYDNQSELDYLDKSTKFNIKNFFDGELEGFGITQGQNGKISSTKTVKISAKWDSDKGVIQQSWVNSDGSKENRTWLITLSGNETYSAIGHDMTSPAAGKQIGNASQMYYTLSLNSKEEGKKEEVKFNDKLYLVDEKSALMISTSKKKSGSSEKAIISIRKVSVAKQQVEKPTSPQ